MLKWEQKQSNTPITHYVFYYREDKKSIWIEMTYTPVTDQSGEQASTIENIYKLTGLNRGTVYQIYMKSIGDKSTMSEPSDTITVRTEGESIGKICKHLNIQCF